MLPTVERTGFVRTLGGADVYLAVRARVPLQRRQDLDQVVEAGELQIKPAARGCIYLVPRRHVSLCLRFADLRTRVRAEREHERAGIRTGELDAVAAAVVDTLAAQGPMTTDAIRRALPKELVRSLGADGKKVGISSPLPPTLRLLEFSGRVERNVEGGRLDTERYHWRLPERNPFDEYPVPDEPQALNARLAEVFLRAAGLATLKAFAAWAGISQRDAREALKQVPAIPVQVDDRRDTFLLLEERHPWLDDSAETAHPTLLPFEDNLIACQGGLQLLVDPEYHQIEVTAWGSKKKRKLGEAKHADLRSIVAEGTIVGFWEYHPDRRAIVQHCFAPISPQSRRRLDEAVSDTARFLAEEIGHGRSFSLDTDESLRRRAAMIEDL